MKKVMIMSLLTLKMIVPTDDGGVIVETQPQSPHGFTEKRKEPLACKKRSQICDILPAAKKEKLEKPVHNDQAQSSSNLEETKEKALQLTPKSKPLSEEKVLQYIGQKFNSEEEYKESSNQWDTYRAISTFCLDIKSNLKSAKEIFLYSLLTYEYNHRSTERLLSEEDFKDKAWIIILKNKDSFLNVLSEDRFEQIGSKAIISLFIKIFNQIAATNISSTTWNKIVTDALTNSIDTQPQPFLYEAEKLKQLLKIDES